MTHNTQLTRPIRIIQIDAIINQLAAQEKFFSDLGLPIEVFNFPDYELAKPLLFSKGNLFDLILIHETIINPDIYKQLPGNTTIAIVNASRKEFDKKIVKQKINQIGSKFKQIWFKEIFQLPN